MDAISKEQRLRSLREDLEYYFEIADSSLRAGNFDVHYVQAGQFHRTATKITALTGVDPRPPYVERARW